MISINTWLDHVRNPDVLVRGAAWPRAADYGAAAIKALAQIMAEADSEIARAAKRALWIIVRRAGHSSRSTSRREHRLVETQLLDLLSHPAIHVRREAAWMLSEIGGPGAATALAALLTDKEVREDARCALIRIADAKPRRILRQALASAPEDFKPALAESLRQLGETVTGYPAQKLVPTKQTTVQPLSKS